MEAFPALCITGKTQLPYTIHTLNKPLSIYSYRTAVLTAELSTREKTDQKNERIKNQKRISRTVHYMVRGPGWLTDGLTGRG